jgi:hypothetical protein
MGKKDHATKRGSKGVEISGFWIPEPDLKKSLKVYPSIRKEIDSYASQSDMDTRITKDVLDIEFQI